MKQSKSKEYVKAYNKKYHAANKQRYEDRYIKNREHILETKRKYRINNYEQLLLTDAKKRANQKSLPFNIDLSDIVIPSMCPILNIPLIISKVKPSANSPSVDRIIPEKGYTKGNVQIISRKANTMKSNATPGELKRFANWIVNNI